MTQESAVSAVAHVIQLAVAPVFLLSAIGAMLSVMTNRLSRIVDRARSLERELAQRGMPPEPSAIDELRALSQRRHFINRAITLCTLTALLICSVIAVLFIGAFLTVDASRMVGILFVAAMFAFIVGLLMFLREIFLASRTAQIGIDNVSGTR